MAANHLFGLGRYLVLIVATVALQCCGQQYNEEIPVFVTEGQDKVLECQFNPDYFARNAAFYWIRTNKEGKDNVAIEKVALDNHYRVEFSPMDGKYSLFINNTTYEKDNGKFECRVKESGSGMDLHTQNFKLTVLIPPGPPQISTPNSSATEGKAFQLTCSSTGGSPDPEIRWYRDGNPSSLDGVVTAGSNKDTPTVNALTIIPRKEDDGTLFKCSVWNKASEQLQAPKLETTIAISVNYIPRITIQPRNSLRVERDTQTSVTCRVDAKPEPISIRWNHHGRVVSNGANLSIKPSTDTDSGVYVCIADNGLGTPGQAELDVDILYGPTIHMETKREAQENEDVSVRCNVSANPPAEIQWFKEGNPSFSATGDTLRLQQINTQSMGRYICQASNELNPSTGPGPNRKVANASVLIWIKHRPGQTRILPENVIGVEGESMTLTCQASPPGWPDPVYRWWKNDPSNTLPSSMNFTISQVRASHEGTYYCRASNELGEGPTASTVLRVYEPPRLVTPLQPQLIKRAGEADLLVFCVARAKPRPVTNWLRNGNPVNDTDLFDIATEETPEKNGVFIVKSTLRFKGLARPNKNQLIVDDRGVYTCEFDNQVRIAASNMTLKIEHGPQLRHTNKKVAFDIGNSALLECRMQAYPSPTFQWSFQNTAISPGVHQYEVNQTSLGDDLYMSVLRVAHLRDIDYGEYTCSASNSLDTARTHIKLVPRGPPEAPTELHATNIDDTVVNLQWTEGFNGGYPSTEFRVTFSSDHDLRSKSERCATSSCAIIGLTETTSYSFKVQATNEGGSSDFSNEIQVQTKVNSQSIPIPRDVKFSKDNGQIYFLASPTKFTVVAKVEILREDDDWQLYQDNIPITNTQGSYTIATNLRAEEQVRVSLCVMDDITLCGHPQVAVIGHHPALIKASAAISTQNVIIIAVCSVLGALLVIGIAIVCCCCCRRNNKEKTIKKDYEMETPNSRPKAITGPYYPEGIVNKGVENSTDQDEPNKGNQYITNMPLANNQHMMIDGQMQNLQMPNGTIHPGFSYLDRDYNNSNNGGSVDSQDSLWLKANGDPGTERSYGGYEPSLTNAYLYPDDYHHVHEDLMNQRNREHIYNSDPYAPIGKPKKRNDHIDSYRGVSEVPDPYTDGEKLPHSSVSFDESLESGYSTPNSRSRRVIREIIV